MNLQLVEEGIFDAVQQQRIMKDMAEFRQGDVPYLQYTYCEVKHVSFTAPSSEMENEISLVLTEFANMLDENLPEDEDRIDNHSAALDAVILDRTATHLSVLAEVDFPKVNLEFRLFYHYLDIDPIGPMIEGDIIVQGAMADSHYGPALGVIECDVNGDGNYSEVAYITPSKMMITPGGPTDDFGGADGGDNTTKFLMPITVYKDFQNKPLQIKIYCQRFSEIQYDAVDENITDLTAPEKRHEYFLTNLILPPSNANLPETGDTSELKEEGRDHLSNSDEFHNSLVIRGIRVATDYDEVIALQNEGYELCCTLVTPTGTISDQDHIWKFHVLAEFGPPNEPGLEDLMFIKCLKSLGTLPVIPFFEVLHDYDLSKPEDDYSVYIAVKMGMSPKFKKLVMISCAMEHEESLELFITTISGFFRLAPPELDKSMDGHCGLLLSYESVIPDTIPTRRPLTDTPSTPQQPQRKQSVAKMKPDDEQSMPGSEEDEEEEDEDDDVYIDEEERIRQLQQVLYDLEAEKKSLLQSNQELQKKAVTLMTREKALQGQSNPTGTANASRPAQTTEGGTAGEGGGDPNNPSGTGGGGTGQPEQNIEKEKQYQDVLTLIVEERKKLNKQLKEFDQLALDLQTRLDDKEFKAKSIATSFKQFKKEILQKAENSRTGHQISKVQIQQIENSELKHEEDLEKIRLRNISLKSLQKKLEKTLRQREQLAEGLHMIDFEQLKIENQTLNEKIEERNEELSKLKRKKTLTVQILTHIREKLKYIELQNNLLKQKVNTLETFITTKRNSVTIKKLERDELRIENKEYKAKQGFATSDLLLLDYEKRKYQTQEVEANIMELKNRYDLLTKQLQFTNTSNIFSSSMGEGSGGGVGGGGRSIKFGGLLSSSAVRETTSAGGGLGNGGLQVSRGMNANTKPGMMSAGNYKLSR